MRRKSTNFLLIDDDEIFCSVFASRAKKESVVLDFISDPVSLLDINSRSSNADQYDVVLVDIDLGINLSGFDLFSYLEGIFPSALVYLISACSHRKLNGYAKEILSKSIGVDNILKKTLENMPVINVDMPMKIDRNAFFRESVRVN